jgi:hypothetical protein
MLERAALHQTRFRTPGVAPDARGVLLGERGLVLFASIDRAIAFLRAYGDEGGLDELIPSLTLRRVITPLRTREVLLGVLAESSYRMDRIAGFARLTGGLVFTGTARHFVQYRDAASPLGYDLDSLAETPADVVLYHDTFTQTYTVEGDLALRELVQRLSLEPDPGAASRSPRRLYATAETGVGHALIRYFFRSHVQARAALVEWPAASAFDDGPRRAHVFELTETPARIVALLRALPGVRVFEPVVEGAAVELGHRHPIALESCPSLFRGGDLTLFRVGAPVDTLSPLPPFAPVRALVRPTLALGDATTDVPHARPAETPAPLALPLRVRPSTEPWRRVRAAVVPLAQRTQLARMLYVLPPRTLAALRIALTDDAAYLVDPAGIEGVPLGTFYAELATGVFVPAGSTLEPAVGGEVLAELARQRGDGLVFFEPGREAPTFLPSAALGPVSRHALGAIAAVPLVAAPPEPDAHDLPRLEYGEPTRFPLRHLPPEAIDLDFVASDAVDIDRSDP